MKTFHQYLTESAKTFDYRIKILGDVDSDFVKEFRKQLKKFDPSTVSEIKKTPVMGRHEDFPTFSNERVNIMDVTFRYPATPPQIQEIAKLLGLDVDRICIKQQNYADGIDQELMGIEQQKDLLTDTNFPAPSAEQREESKDYAAVGADKSVVKNSAAESQWTVAGGKTPPAETTNDLPMGVKSPMTSVQRPPRPVTGFMK